MKEKEKNPDIHLCIEHKLLVSLNSFHVFCDINSAGDLTKNVLSKMLVKVQSEICNYVIS